MKSLLLGDVPTDVNSRAINQIALILRLGLSFVFITGGWWKLSRALNAELSTALVEKYMASNGYINSFFDQFLFQGSVGDFFTPLGFLIALSAFELISGFFLLAGFLVRSISFTYAFLLWSFVIALPVITVIGAGADIKSHYSPAMLVQIRDIGLSGVFFALLSMGSGKPSIDQNILGFGYPPKHLNWNYIGLLLRLSVGVVFVIGGIFYGFNHIKSFISSPFLLTIIGVLLMSGYLTRIIATIAFLIILWYSIGKLSIDAGFWDNLNAIKRELAFMSATIVLTLYGGGKTYRPGQILVAPKVTLLGLKAS